MGLSILLIEDDTGDQKLVKIAVASSGIPAEVHAFTGADEALAHLLDVKNRREFGRLPDFILLDLNLPRMSGFEFLRQLRANPLLFYIPTIILSNSNAETDIRSAMQYSASGYFRKPSDLSSLKRIIKIIMEYWDMNQKINYLAYE